MLSSAERRDQLMEKIFMKVAEITGDDNGKMINLDGINCRESGNTGFSGKINVTCLFFNDDGRVCTDIYRSGTTGSVDFICGIPIESVGDRSLKHIYSALEEKRWTISHTGTPGEKKKSKISSALRELFFQKGA